MPISCPQCHREMPDAAAFCPGCGRRVIDVPAAVGPAGPLRENIAAALAYVSFFPAIFFLLTKPFKSNHFVRFHSLQSLCLAAATIVAAITLRIIFFLFGLVPHIGPLLAWLSLVVFSIGWVILWLVVLIKALQGDLFKLPIVGDFAERV
jgi:uncharacterized membrane protein